MLCVLPAGCGLPGYRAGAQGGDDAVDCNGAAPDAAAAHALLRLGCDGELLPGRATWSVEGGVVTLDFGTGAGRPGQADGPVGAELVRTWPPLDAAPWLGHRVVDIAVEGERVHVEFAGGSDEPERLFADLRLSGVRRPAIPGDARDAIDGGGAEVVTHHDASIEYARALGWAVRRIAWDRLYLAVFAGDTDAGRSRLLAGRVAADWVGWGAPGARRAPALRWASIRERCGGNRPGAGAAGDVRSSPPARPTVSYPAGDQAARQAAERLVSAGMRGGDEAGAMAALTGSAERLAVRAESAEPPVRAASDVAAVVVVHAGPGHPCTLHAEVLRAASAWSNADGVPNAHILLLGEAATFLVGREVP